MRDCIKDDEGCIVCPYIAPTPSEPGRIEFTAPPAWDAGANSVKRIVAPGVTTWNITVSPNTVGAVVGLRRYAQDATNPTRPETVAHGFAFSSVGDMFRGFRIIEAGEYKTEHEERFEDDRFAIQIAGSRVRYTRNGVVVFRSPSLFAGAAIRYVVTGCLYSPGDIVGGIWP